MPNDTLFGFRVALLAGRGIGLKGGQGGGYLFRPDRLRWIARSTPTRCGGPVLKAMP
jgi:hypothetical protein